MKSGLLFRLLLVSICIGIISGCQSRLLTYNGRIVEETDRIFLPEGKTQASAWITDHLTLAYECTRLSDRISFSGSVELTNIISGGFNNVEHLFVRVHFLNSDGRIIHWGQLFASDHMENIKRWTFSREFTVPPETAALAFSYSGQAYDSGDKDGSVSVSFWKIP